MSAWALTTSAHRAHRPLSNAQGQESTGPDARAAINAGLAPPIATHLLVASFRVRDPATFWAAELRARWCGLGGRYSRPGVAPGLGQQPVKRFSCLMGC
jgi:hypothetical protein